MGEQFTEELHPRASDGKFGSGGGNRTGGPAPAALAHGGRRYPTARQAMLKEKARRRHMATVGGIQQALNRLGVRSLSGRRLKIDGKDGKRTIALIREAQRRMGLKQDGKASPELLRRLRALKVMPGKPLPRPKRRTTKTRPKATTRPRTARRADDHDDADEVERAWPMSLFDRTFALDSIEISRSHSDGRTVEAYAAVFNTPTEVRDQHGHYTEVISPTAFAKTLAERAHKVSVFYNHGYNLHGQPDMLGSVPIGQPVEIRADARGLFTVTRYNKSALAESVLEAIRAGDIRGQSFRGRIYQSTPHRVPGHRAGGPLPTVTRTELGLTEYGPTPSPVYADAQILAVRAEQIVAQIVGLSDDERHALLEMLRSTTPLGSETASTTPAVGAGTEEPHPHSGRIAIRRALLRAKLIEKGVRRG